MVNSTVVKHEYWIRIQPKGTVTRELRYFSSEELNPPQSSVSKPRIWKLKHHFVAWPDLRREPHGGVLTTQENSNEQF
jgi:hypothetical protein